MPLADAIPYPGNPRRGDQEAITGSIRDLGLYAGVILQRSTGHILVGNHRRHGVEELGGTMIPADYLDVDDVRAAAIVARDNRTSDLGTYDVHGLATLLQSDPEVLDLSGYDEPGLQAILRAASDLDFTRTASAPGGIPLGDLAPPIDLDRDGEKVTVTLDPGHRPELYALLKDLPYVRNVTNQHVRSADD